MRPHHLLCTQGYSGKGYDDVFVRNMTVITSRLRNEDNTQIEIVFCTDDICTHCPHKAGEDLCDENARVKAFDKKVTDYFGIEERSYIYQDIIKEINAKMTASMMDDICGSCNWYPVSACKRVILGCDHDQV